MKNPLGHSGERENFEKQESKVEKDSQLSFRDIVSDQLTPSVSLRGRLNIQRLLSPGSETSYRSPYMFVEGRTPQFQSRQADYSHARIEKPLPDFRSQIDDFLKETSAHEDIRLTAAEREELRESRDNLKRSLTGEDALAKALHLARLYQHMRYIEEARKATELSLGLNPDSQLARELLRDLERLHPPDIAVARAKLSPAPVRKTDLRRRIIELARGSLIVLGDLLVDELLQGKAARISREAPVIILEHEQTEHIPGGAANTAANIAALGGRCHAIGIVGRDEYASILAALFDQAGISHSLVEDPSRPTTVKTRILSARHSQRQQLLRLDRITHEPISALIEHYLVEKLEHAAAKHNAVVLSDYQAGLMTQGVINACRKIAGQMNLKLIVDAQDRFERFAGATILTPNQPDVEAAVGYKISSLKDLSQAGSRIMELSGSSAVLVTRGAEGMALFQPGGQMISMPAFNRTEVFDVSGAGDTVAATVALALTTGASLPESMALGNLAASIVVRKPGTAVTTQKEMLDALDALDAADIID